MFLLWSRSDFDCSLVFDHGLCLGFVLVCISLSLGLGLHPDPVLVSVLILRWFFHDGGRGLGHG